MACAGAMANNSLFMNASPKGGVRNTLLAMHTSDLS